MLGFGYRTKIQRHTYSCFSIDPHLQGSLPQYRTKRGMLVKYNENLQFAFICSLILFFFSVRIFLISHHTISLGSDNSRLVEVVPSLWVIHTHMEVVSIK